MTSSQPTQPLTEDEFEELTDELYEIRERVALRRGFSKDPNTQWQRDEEALLAMADKLLSERGRLRTWDGLMELLDEKWPEDIFPTREDDTARDPGPRILSLLRWNIRLRRELHSERERLNEALAENVRRLGEITGLHTKAKRAWSEGHSAALAAGCDSEDEFRANLGVLLVAEEHRCQLAINEEPLNPHLHGTMSGLQRARDIVTGDAFRALGLDQDGEGQANA